MFNDKQGRNGFEVMNNVGNKEVLQHNMGIMSHLKIPTLER